MRFPEASLIVDHFDEPELDFRHDRSFVDLLGFFGELKKQQMARMRFVKCQLRFL